MKRTLELEAFYPQPPERVWAALTESAALADWLMDNDFQAVVGHRFSFRTRPSPGWDGTIEGVVLRVEPFDRLEYTWVNRKNGLDTTVCWKLSPAGSGTRLTLEHRGFEGVRPMLISELLRRGWGSLLSRRLPQAMGTPAAPLGPGARRIALAIAAAALLAFLWGGLSWELLPWHRSTLGGVQGADALLPQLRAAMPASGMYLVPDPRSAVGEAHDRAVAGLLAGPSAFVAWRTGPFAPTAMLLQELARQLLGAMVLVAVQLGTRPTVPARIGVALLLAAFAGLAGPLQQWVHFSFATDYTAVGLADLAIAWGLAGAVAALILRPTRPEVPR